MLNRLRITLLSAALRLADALSRPTRPIGCYECCGPFRRMYLDTQVVVCDEHYESAEGAPDIEFAAPFEPMTARRFFLLLEAADEGWLPAGARIHNLSAARR